MFEPELSNFDGLDLSSNSAAGAAGAGSSTAKPTVLHTYAEMDKALKNKISHRYRSLDALRTYLIANADEIVAQSQATKVPKME